MGVRNAGRTVMVLIASLQLTGCYKTVMQPRVIGPMPDSIVVAEADPPWVLHHPAALSSTVWGWRMVSPGDSALVEVSGEIPVQKFSLLRTTGAFLGAGMLVQVIGCVITDCNVVGGY